jgi:hypothetical protein
LQRQRERLAVVLADIVNSTDIGMIQSRSGFGFAAETLQDGGTLCGIRWEKFQSDATVQTGVLGLVNNAHPTSAKAGKDAVVGNGLSK